MARNGSGVYSLPPGSVVVSGDTSDPADINTPLADIAADLNTVRPVVAGGTGASSASGARTALGIGGMGAQEASAVAITGGAIDGATVGSTTPASGAFTTLTASGDASVQALTASGAVTVGSVVQHEGDTDNQISFTTGAQSFQIDGENQFNISSGGVRIGGTGARVDEIETTITDSDTKAPTSGAVVDYVASQITFPVKAWGNFSASGGTITVNDSGNVSGMVRNGTGAYEVTFTTAMSSANYAAVVSAWDNTAGSGIDIGARNQSTTDFIISAEGGGGTSANDPDNISFIVVG